MLRQILQKSGPQQLVDDGRPFPQVCNTIGVSLSPDLDTPVPPTGASPSPQDIGAPPIEVVSSAPAGVSERGKVSARGLSRDDRFGALASRFVVRFTCRGITTYLHSYDDTGVWPTFRLDQAKLFASRTVIEAIATLLRGEVCRVVVSGQEIRLAILQPEIQIEERRRTNSTVITEFPVPTSEDGAGARADGAGQIPPSFLTEKTL